MKQLPEYGQIRVSADTAQRLYQAAQLLPCYANKDYYDLSLQQQVLSHFQQSCRCFTDLIAQIKFALSQPPFTAVVRGLSFDEHHRLLVAVNRAFGPLVARPFDSHTPRAQLIHHVQPQEDIVNQRAQWDKVQKLSEKLHIDGADRPTPVRYVSMQCVQHDTQGGGRSRVIDIDGFRTTIHKANPQAIDILESQPAPWLMADYLGGAVIWRPILAQDQLIWRHYSIEAALAAEPIELSASLSEVITSIDQILADDDSQVYEFNLLPSDFLMVDNQRCLHARSPIVQPSTERLMLRAWIE